MAHVNAERLVARRQGGVPPRLVMPRERDGLGVLLLRVLGPSVQHLARLAVPHALKLDLREEAGSIEGGEGGWEGGAGSGVGLLCGGRWCRGFGPARAAL